MEYDKFLKKVFNSLRIPMALYRKEMMVKVYGAEGFRENIVSHILGNYRKRKEALFFSVDTNGLLAGVVSIDEEFHLLVGPAISASGPELQPEGIGNNLNLPESQWENLKSWLTEIPRMELRCFAAALELIDQVLTGRDETAIEVEVQPLEDFELFLYEEINPFQNTASGYKARILSDIEYGNLEDLEKMLHTWYLADEKGIPVIANNLQNSMRQIFTVLIVLSEQAAVRGGVEEQEALSMSDHFFSYVYKFRTAREFMVYFKKVIFSFAKKVNEVHNIDTDSYLVKRIEKEIIKHIQEKTTPETIAENLNMNVSYLCRHFKEHTGKTISEYVNERKMREAMCLLKSTELSVTQISDRLGYTTQNYFQRVFKKVTGQTPAHFRRNGMTEKGV